MGVAVRRTSVMWGPCSACIAAMAWNHVSSPTKARMWSSSSGSECSRISFTACRFCASSSSWGRIAGRVRAGRVGALATVRKCRSLASSLSKRGCARPRAPIPASRGGFSSRYDATLLAWRRRVERGTGIVWRRCSMSCAIFGSVTQLSRQGAWDSPEASRHVLQQLIVQKHLQVRPRAESATLSLPNFYWWNTTLCIHQTASSPGCARRNGINSWINE